LEYLLPFAEQDKTRLDAIQALLDEPQGELFAWLILANCRLLG
jgi:hypothetical protein